MLQRHVYVKLHDEHAHDAGRREALRRVREAAAGAGVRLLGAGVPADDASRRSWDLAFLLPLEDAAAWAGVEAEVIRPRAACVKGWNFELDGAA